MLFSYKKKRCHHGIYLYWIPLIVIAELPSQNVHTAFLCLPFLAPIFFVNCNNKVLTYKMCCFTLWLFKINNFASSICSQKIKLKIQTTGNQARATTGQNKLFNQPYHWTAYRFPVIFSY